MPSNTAGPSAHLTPRQLQLLKMVAGSQENQCYSPTLGEMACELSLSRSTVFEHIAELRKKGLLSGSPNRARSLTLSSAAYELLSGVGERAFSVPVRAVSRPSWPRSAEGVPPSDRGRDARDTNALRRHYKPEGIPLAGRVAAGAPVEAVENVEQLSLTGCFGGGDDLFALEVTGQSMIDKDIREGDYVICRRSRVAENGQLVVAIVDERDATLKRFYREADRVRLQPANDDYDPIYSDNCRIEAIVIGLVRKL